MFNKELRQILTIVKNKKANKLKAEQPAVTDGNSKGKNLKYSEDDILNAGITRDYKNSKEQREIEAIREERKMQERINTRIDKHKKNL